MDVDETAHQIPLSPSAVLQRRIASGILAPVNIIEITLHRCVFPRPDSAPTVISSTHINASLIPTIIR